MARPRMIPRWAVALCGLVAGTASAGEVMVGAGYGLTGLRSSHHVLLFQGPSLDLGVSLGSVYGFRGALGAGFPLWGRESGRWSRLSAAYAQGIQWDLSAGAGRKWRFGNQGLLDLQLAAHGQYFGLPGMSEYRDITTLSLGGLLGLAYRFPIGKLQGKPLRLGGSLQLTADPWELFHVGDVGLAWGLRLALQCAWDWS